MTSNSNKKQKNLLDHKLALHSYLDDLLQEIYFAEVKLNKDKIKMNKLKEKTEKIHKKYSEYNAIYEGLSMTDIDRKIKENNITK